MIEERDQILTKLRALLEEYTDRMLGMNEGRSVYALAAWIEACNKLKSLIEEIDPDSLIPVEQPLKWHSDYLEFAEASSESLSRGMLRKCLQCQRCKAGMETEIVKGEPATKKRIQCSCGHVQLVSFFQNGQ